MALCIATMHEAPLWPKAVDTLEDKSRAGLWMMVHHNTATDNLGVVGSYQALYKRAVEADMDILAYIHDDVEIYEKDWDERVLKEFEDDRVGVVGFGGALRHGSEDLYKVPYKLQQLARYEYHSNVTDAEVHGERFQGERDVAVLDGFSLAVRRSVLDRSNGWPQRLQFHCYDYWLCGIAHRLDYTVRLVGVRCHHFGGRTSTTKEYQEWAKQNGGGDVKVHEEAHRYVYEEFRDVLPWRCR